MSGRESEADFPERTSLILSVAGFAGMAALGFLQFAKDGSFWIDEASVALSLTQLEPLETFGPLVGGQSFPRLYLFAIRGFVELFGYETMVARALPLLFFWLATAAWVRLLYLRFRGEPLLVALGLALLLIPGTWFVYGALLKPYTLDVLLACVPFLLRDSFYDETLEHGQSPGRLIALAALGLFSYPFTLALLARCGGWWLGAAASGRRSVSPRGVLTGLAGVAVASSLVWFGELRHTSPLGDSLRGFWAACLIGAEGTSTAGLLDRFAFGWWDGRADFSRGGGLDPASLWVLKLGFGVGLARLAWTLVRPEPLPRPHKAWGSRSLGCAVLLVGLPFASLLGGYPICSGRLTLFAFLPVVLVTLEGISFTIDRVGGWPRGHWIAALLTALLVVWISPTSYRNASTRVASQAPQDLRPQLARVREAPGMPILTNKCTRKQIETLPEPVPEAVLYVEEGGGVTVATSDLRAAWFLYVPDPHCRSWVGRVREGAESWTPRHAKGDAARLFEARFPGTAP